MSEDVGFDPTPPDDRPDYPPPLDLGTLNATDVPPDDSFGVPDTDASRDPRRPLFSRRREEAPKTPRARAPRVVKVPASKPGQFVPALTQMYVMLGTGVYIRDQVCGAAIIENAESCAKSLDELARQNDAVRKALFMLMQTNALGFVIVAHFPIVLAIATHHVPAVERLQADIGTRVAEAFANSAVPDDDGSPGDADEGLT